MQNTSVLYRSILAAEGHWFESKAVIAGVTYDETKLKSVSTQVQMFGDEPKIGTAVAQEINITIFDPTAYIPVMAEIDLYTRVCNATQESEWIPQGVFFIDTRERSVTASGITTLEIHGYDAMLKGEQAYESTDLNWPAVDVDIVDEIAGKMGVEVDERTYDLMIDGYEFPLPTGYTLREMLAYIASIYVGWFIITEEGKLRLVTLLELPPETRLLIDQVGNYITFGGDRIMV